MLDPQSIGLAARHLEGLVILSSGSLAIWLGYRLSRGTPLAVWGMGRLRLPGGRWLAVPGVGPGMLFALFGASVLASGLHHETPETRRPAAAVARALPSAGSPSPAFEGVFEGRVTDTARALPARTVLWREGDRVTGVYSYGLGEGELSGIVQDDTLILIWQSGGRHGLAQIRTARGGVEFDGTWGYGETAAGGGTWTGARRGR